MVDNTTKNNLIAIILYAFAIASALSFNELIGTIIKKYTGGTNELVSKFVYVFVMFSSTLVLAYFTHSTVPV